MSDLIGIRRIAKMFYESGLYMEPCSPGGLCQNEFVYLTRLSSVDRLSHQSIPKGLMNYKVIS